MSYDYLGNRREDSRVFYLRWRHGYVVARGFDTKNQADYACVKRGMTTHGCFTADQIHNSEQLADISK